MIPLGLKVFEVPPKICGKLSKFFRGKKLLQKNNQMLFFQHNIYNEKNHGICVSIYVSFSLMETFTIPKYLPLMV